MQIRTTIMENSMEVPQKAKNSAPEHISKVSQDSIEMLAH
jgi:hypothetical protein